MPLIDRPVDAQNLREAMAHAPVTLLTGPRQAGKSTLARQTVVSSPSAFFDLEDHRDLARLAEPTLALRDHGETLVIDEAQRMPDLFPMLRVLVDENRRPGRFLILGSASPDLVGLGSESLAGRVTFVELGGLRLTDVGADRLDDLWLRGGLPESFVAPTDEASNRWRDDYISTFLERDLANLGFRFPAATMRRFWTMLAHYHGQTWNGARIARSIDVSESTVRRYIDALTDALVVRQVPSWFANVSKRQVKSPRVYIRDSGLLHRLLGITSMLDLERSPVLGASWEGMVVEQLLARFPQARSSLLVHPRRCRTRPAVGDRRTSPRVRNQAHRPTRRLQVDAQRHRRLGPRPPLPRIRRPPPIPSHQPNHRHPRHRTPHRIAAVTAVAWGFGMTLVGAGVLDFWRTWKTTREMPWK